MKENLQKTCDLVLENRKELKNSMFWELDSNSYAIMAALLNTAKGRHADAKKYKECKRILHENVNVVSEIRGLAEAVVITKMTLAEDPTTYIQGVCAVYKKLRSIHKLTASANMVMTAMNIYEHTGIEGADADIEKLEELYKTLEKQHPFLISDEDRPYLSMVTAAGLNIPSTIEKIETSYDACKDLSLIHKGALHSLAQILAFSNENADVNRTFVKSMISGLSSRKVEFSKSHGLAAIGALALLNMPADVLCDDIAEVNAYLKTQKGFKWYSTDPWIRSVYAMLIVFMAYAPENVNLAASIGSNITMAIIEEIITTFMIVVCASASYNACHSSAGAQ